MLQADFHVVGVKFLPPQSYVELQSLKEGDFLDLVAQPDNVFDPLAVGVFSNGIQVGFVPNKGYSCPRCYKPVDLKSPACALCGETGVATYGLAGRLTKGKFLEESVKVFVTGVDDVRKNQGKDGFIRATISVVEKIAPL